VAYAIRKGSSSKTDKNLTLPGRTAWVLFRNRADAENKVLELKEECGFDNFNAHDFLAIEAASNVVVMGLFRQAYYDHAFSFKSNKCAFGFLSIGSYIVTNGIDQFRSCRTYMQTH
jgi:hypothetical protein